MARTQIYLGASELELLDRATRATGASRSELIRRAVRSTFGEKTKAERLRALAASAGSWKGPRPSGADYVDARRGDLKDADYVLAATALVLEAELLTTNVRHFPMLRNLRAAY